MNPHNALLKAVLDAHIFRRNKRPLESKILASPLHVWNLLQGHDLTEQGDRGQPRVGLQGSLEGEALPILLSASVPSEYSSDG
jgi:hypothetical protein